MEKLELKEEKPRLDKKEKQQKILKKIEKDIFKNDKKEKKFLKYFRKVLLEKKQKKVLKMHEALLEQEEEKILKKLVNSVWKKSLWKMTIRRAKDNFGKSLKTLVRRLEQQKKQKQFRNKKNIGKTWQT